MFKSWAVTKGPSLDPKDKRLAVETEDHPLDYGDFEGTIPKGEYGGGTVMLWDRGFWASRWRSAKALRKGELRFTLAGEKLQGSWVLVRLRHDRERGKRTNWLLIKHHDGYEREGDDDELLARGSLGRLRAAAWRRSPPARAAARSHSCSARRTASRPMRSGTRTAMAAKAPARPPRSRRTEANSQSTARKGKPRGPCRPSSRRSSASASAARRRARTGCMRSSSTAIACSCASRTARP